MSLLRCNCTGQKTACVRHKISFIPELGRACADSKLKHFERCDMQPSWIHSITLLQVLSSTPCRSHTRSPWIMSQVTLSTLTSFFQKACPTAIRYVSPPVAAQPASQVDRSCHSPPVQDSITSSNTQTNPATVNRSLQV